MEQFERYACANAPACAARDISDHALDYGEWLASSLGVAPLSRLRVLESFYIEAGPGEDGESLSLGAVSFLSPNSDQTEAIVAQLAAIPDGAFKAGKVIMRFKPLVDGDRIDRSSPTASILGWIASSAPFDRGYFPFALVAWKRFS